MSTLFLSQTINRESDKEFTTLLDSVDVNVKISAPIHSNAVADKYRFVSEVICAEEPAKTPARRKNLKELMQQSFFHGAGWMGENFIA